MNAMQGGPAWETVGAPAPAPQVDTTALWNQYVQQAGGIDKVAPQGSQMDSLLRSGQMPDVKALPGGIVSLSRTNHDAGITGWDAPDGRTVLDRFGPQTGHWDNPQQENIGFTLRDKEARNAADWGLNLTPQQQQALGKNRLNRWESFDTTGKSEGYGYEIADDRNFFEAVIQDLGPVLMAPVMGWASPALAGGIQGLTGLGAGASQALAGSLLGGTTSALGGGSFLKGALAGGIGGAVNAYNPAQQLGVSEAFQRPVNSFLGGTAKGVLAGQDFDEVLKGQLTNPTVLMSLADKAGLGEYANYAGAVLLAKQISEGDPKAVMQGMSLLRGIGNASGGLIQGDAPDTVQDARLLSGIASNLTQR